MPYCITASTAFATPTGFENMAVRLPYIVVVLFVQHVTPEECTTQKCVLTAARLLSKMDPLVDPCVDFYDYACGQWINNSVNLNYPSWNVLYETNMKAHDKMVHAMLKVIDGDSSVPFNRGERAAIELFRQCTDMDKLKTIGLNTWLRFVEATNHDQGIHFPPCPNLALFDEWRSNTSLRY
ncbi:hypothetical protein GCK32_019072 [Trichostrongylus colubriformis]|uniref:Peptidase M13 N-terminal domain-containing protein n=1 Tax=Trichostrongylus colubriformis TaxID=6319 RepID=A0AAN8F8K4_TRICO